ncbi:MAG: DUF2442 domain-containing protein [Anaerolineae bacterium]
MDSRQSRIPRLVRVVSVQVLRGFRVRVRFEDDTIREIDLSPLMRGPVFEPMRRDPATFRSLRVVGGVLTWPNGADIDPDVLYHDLKPAWAAVDETTTQV